MKFFRHLRDVMRFMQLPHEQRRLTFYSEGKNYWPHLEGLVRGVLATYDIPVCYISSAENDPGLLIKHPNYRAFKIDESFVRNWFFENIETDVMVMTMPDLHQYQVKRSKHKVHYVYVQHSLVSLHMVYRKGAFDHYDTVFCAGPHHINEIRAMETNYNLLPKQLVEHGYGRLDAIIEEHNKRPKKIPSKHVLIAPSWGHEAIIESGVGEDIVNQLIAQEYQVTLRPHPQTIKFANDKVDAIVNQHQNNPLFVYENNVAGQDSLHDSDLMICDWSGAALDYAFGLNKPVLFIDVPRKVNNTDYKELGIEPFEVYIRDKIGKVVNPGNLQLQMDELSLDIEQIKSYVFNPEKSSAVGAKYLLDYLGHK